MIRYRKKTKTSSKEKGGDSQMSRRRAGKVRGCPGLVGAAAGASATGISTTEASETSSAAASAGVAAATTPAPSDTTPPGIV